MMWMIMGMALIVAVFLFKVWFPNVNLYRPAFPIKWREFLHEQVKFYRHLDEAGKAKFERDVQDVMRRGRIRGEPGFLPDEELRLLIAAGFATVFHALAARVPIFKDAIIISPGDEPMDIEPMPGRIAAAMDGTPWKWGPMYFSAGSIRLGFEKPNDGFNPVLRRLAQYLDFELKGFEMDDIPMGLDPSRLRKWRQVRDVELEKIRRHDSPFSKHCLKNEGDLFACAVEMFFEDPEPLRAKSPKFYSLLCDYFKLDTCRLYSGAM